MARVALVTGGMGGLGEAICIKLAALGYKVVTTHSPGNSKAQAPSLTECQISALEAFSDLANVTSRDFHHQTKPSASPIMMPGAIPAKKSLEIDTPLTTPKMMNGMDGGMIGAMIPPVAINPAESPGSYPARFIIGRSTMPSAAVSAAAEPERLAISTEAMIVT